MKLDHQVRVTP